VTSYTTFPSLASRAAQSYFWAYLCFDLKRIPSESTESDTGLVIEDGHI
jgi:hypothetical protein